MPALADSKQKSKSADPWDAPDPALALAEDTGRWAARRRSLAERR
jgi:hypothetical protein